MILGFLAYLATDIACYVLGWKGISLFFIEHKRLYRELAEQKEAVRKLSGVRNILADKLAQYTGTTVSDEIKKAEWIDRHDDIDSCLRSLIR